MKLKEIWQELKTVLTGTTLDALLPPILFAILNAIFGLAVAAIGALVLSLGLGVFRLIRNQRWLYALVGLLLAGLASGLGLLTKNAGNYFIPSIVTSALLTLTALISNLLGKPLAAWASHLTRGWPLDWFWREDIKPAYLEVTWAWTVFFLLRLGPPSFPLHQRSGRCPGLDRDPSQLAGHNPGPGPQLCLWYLAAQEAGRAGRGRIPGRESAAVGGSNAGVLGFERFFNFWI